MINKYKKMSKRLRMGKCFVAIDVKYIALNQGGCIHRYSQHEIFKDQFSAIHW